MYEIAQICIHSNSVALHIFSQAVLRREYFSITYLCTKYFKENMKDWNALLFLWCLKGMVISYSFWTPKRCLKAGYFTFCCTWKVKLQRYPLCYTFYLLELHFFLGFTLESGRFVLQKCLKVSTFFIYDYQSM